MFNTCFLLALYLLLASVWEYEGGAFTEISISDLVCRSPYPEISGHYISVAISEHRKYRRGSYLMLLIVNHGTILPSADILHLSTAIKLYMHIITTHVQLWWHHSQCVFSCHVRGTYIMLTTFVYMWLDFGKPTKLLPRPIPFYWPS